MPRKSAQQCSLSEKSIFIRGARQNNLKGFDLRLPLNKLIVVTGVSGSGKSSLAFDTVYSEGQRRYVETFSPYTRQFLDRMDKPKVDGIEGIPPAIAVDQTNPVRTSRSTVGTMTELNDHLKLLYARAADLYCRSCGKRVSRDTPESIYRELSRFRGERRRRYGPADLRAVIVFRLRVPPSFSREEVQQLLSRLGYRRIHREENGLLEVVQDRVVIDEANRARIWEDLEAALEHGQGGVVVYPLGSRGRPLKPLRFSSDLHCPDCDIHYGDSTANLFSFNSPVGACETCRGFGRIIDVDFDLVVPDETLSLAVGAVKPWQTASYRECQSDLMEAAAVRGIPVHVPWRELTEDQRHWVLEGEGSWEEGKWYGVRRFFRWLETKAYKMHIRVLLARYRAYRLCPDCRGARLKPEALLWRLGNGGAGLNIHELMLLPIDRCSRFFRDLRPAEGSGEAVALLLREIRTRLRYLVEVGLGYLTLDRQSRTLSGGEVQRINLTTALGTSLVNTLFVLDEPSIGLHSRDIGRLIRVLERLRDAGNSLIVVEHDPEVIQAADLVVDMGPGPGDRGGEVVFAGSFEKLLRSRRSLTAAYLRRERKVVGDAPAADDRSSPREASGGRGPGEPGFLEILGVREHNLKGLDVRIPLHRLVCITGVSGSGKSTLVKDVAYNALRKLMRRPVDAPGEHEAVKGDHLIDDVVLVDQSPIGKTTRSNPATTVGAFGAIRELFAAEPLAVQRGYTAGTFSFNSGNGRCPTCGGSGFEHIEMQFLSDVYLRCPDCNGRRYRPEILEVALVSSGTCGQGGSRARAASIADVLEMTVAEACDFFADRPEVLDGLRPLRSVGLDYMTLGQPVPTLSGGEAQRLKLAGHLARSGGGRPAGSPSRGGRSSGGSSKGGRGRHLLFLFDEPTTGLHFDDVATLLKAFRILLEAGHSVVVIEHNLEVVGAADWIIDLGPEGGEKGGQIVCAGTPERIVRHPRSHTARAMRAYFGRVPEAARGGSHAVSTAAWASGKAAGAASTRAAPDGAILIRHAREHNLRGIDVRIPREQLTVITGVSGSGKSTVAFDILFAEGQRRYLESLNAYARQFVQPAARPDVDGVYGIPPTVAIEQRTSRGGRKSTVATLTEIYHFLRLLFVKLGIQTCPDCGIPIRPQSPEAVFARMLEIYRGREVLLLAPSVLSRKGYYTDLARWAANRGFTHLRVDGRLVPTDPWPRLDRYREHDIEIPVARQRVAPENQEELYRSIELALSLGKGILYALALPEGESSKSGPGSGSGGTQVFSTQRSCPRCGRSFEELDPRLFSFNSRHGWCPRCYGTGLLLSGFDESQTGEENEWIEGWEGAESVCPDCRGKRLRPEALAVRFQGKNIADFTALSVTAALSELQNLRLDERDAEIARDIVGELRSRLSFLEEVGLPYLTLDRPAPTLSGGEAQRIRLASQLGSNLRGVCYILDEPTIGLHTRDNRLLLKTLQRLKNKGNTVVVVEHDEETIRRAEHIVDLGPGGGINGGRLVAAGTV